MSFINTFMLFLFIAFVGIIGYTGLRAEQQYDKCKEAGGIMIAMANSSSVCVTGLTVVDVK